MEKSCYPLYGIVPIINTPFTDDDRIDVSSLQRLIERSIVEGIAGCIVPAVASEDIKLTPDERKYLTEAVVQLVAGRVPVVVGVSSEDLRESYALAAHAVSIGSDGVLCRVPQSLQNDFKAIKTHFQSFDVPMLMIQDLDWSGPGLPLELIVDMFETIPAFRCLKVETVPSGPKYSAVLQATKGRLNVSGGWAITQMIEALDRGVHAFNTTAINRPFVMIYNLHRAGRRDEAIRIFEMMLPYLAWSHQHIDISIQFLKKYCVRRGLFQTDHVRLPIMDYDEYHSRCGDELIEKIIAIEDQLGIGPAQRSTRRD